MRAPQLTRRTILTKMIEELPRKMLENYAKTGKITGDLLNNPTIKIIGQITGKSGKALLLEVINLMESKTID